MAASSAWKVNKPTQRLIIEMPGNVESQTEGTRKAIRASHEEDFSFAELARKQEDIRSMPADGPVGDHDDKDCRPLVQALDDLAALLLAHGRGARPVK
ncbi:MAG: hypothetical protein QF706_03340 [Roseibacillus sp.]|jgi:hypothetical protein|nr:hypothetical protein [Roseibacillus sp.]